MREKRGREGRRRGREKRERLHAEYIAQLIIIRGESERAPNTRETGSGFICIHIIYIFVCLWGDHFSEERVKF